MGLALHPPTFRHLMGLACAPEATDIKHTAISTATIVFILISLFTGLLLGYRLVGGEAGEVKGDSTHPPESKTGALTGASLGAGALSAGWSLTHPPEPKP